MGFKVLGYIFYDIIRGMSIKEGKNILNVEINKYLGGIRYFLDFR